MEEMIKRNETLRDKSMKDYDQISTKFGLFTQPIGLACGDTQLNKTKKAQLDENGRVLVPPRNIFSGRPKSGKVNSSYFSKPEFVSIGYKYVDPSRLAAQYELQKKQKIPADQPVFRPSSGNTNPLKAPYPYKNLSGKPKPKPTIIDGKVQIEASNCLTGPNVKNLYKPYPIMKDEYDRLRQAEKDTLKLHHEKMKDNPPFKTWTKQKKPFGDNKKTYGEEGIKFQKKIEKVKSVGAIQHERDFVPSNPSKKGLNCTINKFPKYQPNPPKEIVRKYDVKTKEVFKPNYMCQLSRPTTSVTMNSRNIKREMNVMRVQSARRI